MSEETCKKRLEQYGNTLCMARLGRRKTVVPAKDSARLERSELESAD